VNFRSGCEAADVLAARLGMAQAVRDALACTFERWNGKGQPNGVKGERIPLPMRIVHLAQDVEVLARLDKLDPWDAALGREPDPRRVLTGAALDDALEVAADFTDLKSPVTAGHSRQVAALAATACERAGLPLAEAERAWRAGLVHDLGRTAVPNSIWDKPGALTRAELDRVQLHPVFTGQMLRRAGLLDALNPVAACHHEKADGVRADHRPDRQAPGHLPQDSRQSYPAHLRQDRLFHTRRRGPVRPET
jgi:HD-GYP domain-containing protein (c-di-GMP phosphodiesterase class II)